MPALILLTFFRRVGKVGLNSPHQREHEHAEKKKPDNGIITPCSAITRSHKKKKEDCDQSNCQHVYALLSSPAE
jgi:hypothetical protein